MPEIPYSPPSSVDRRTPGQRAADTNRRRRLAADIKILQELAQQYDWPEKRLQAEILDAMRIGGNVEAVRERGRRNKAKHQALMQKVNDNKKSG